MKIREFIIETQEPVWASTDGVPPDLVKHVTNMVTSPYSSSDLSKQMRNRKFHAKTTGGPYQEIIILSRTGSGMNDPLYKYEAWGATSSAPKTNGWPRWEQVDVPKLVSNLAQKLGQKTKTAPDDVLYDVLEALQIYDSLFVLTLKKNTSLKRWLKQNPEIEAVLDRYM